MVYKLMIVEDEPLIRAGLKKYFDWEAFGIHTIVEAENGHDGVNIALNERPDLVITDIHMPKMDGLEMIGQLRTRLPDTLFIILTGHNEFTYAQKAIHYGGVHDFLLKPLQYDVSASSIRSCLDKLKKRKDLQQTDAPLESDEKEDLSSNTDQPVNDVDLFEQIEAFIREHIDQDLTLNAIAEHFFYHPSYLSRLFKTKLNKSYMTFVREIRIHYAQQLLDNPKYSITDIANFSGYRSYKHFVKVFKDITKMTPTEYRRNLRV